MNVHFLLTLPPETISIPLSWKEEEKLDFEVGGKKFSLRVRGEKEKRILALTSLSGEDIPLYASLQFEFENWDPENYVLMPAAVYNGNRTEVWEGPYYPENDFQLLDPPQTTFAIQRLERDGGGKIQHLSGEYAFPCFAFRDRKEALSHWILTPQRSLAGDYSYSLEELKKERKMLVRISAPAFREFRQKGGKKFVPAEDVPFILKKGEILTLEAAAFSRECPTLAQFFHIAFLLRNFMVSPGKLTNIIPYSHAVKCIRERLEKKNFREEYGYYSTLSKDFIAKHPELPFHYQLGWVGGGMRTEYLLFQEDPVSREHAARELDFIFRKAQTPAGFFMTTCENDTFFPDLIPADKTRTPSCHTLLRKNADALSFLSRQMLILRKQPEGVPEEYGKKVKKLAEAFCLLWEKYGQFGYFLDPFSGRITFGGGTGGASACTGLAIASELFQEERFLHVALQSVKSMIGNFLHKGKIYGGVGDAIQASDSESACALLEAIVTVWEYTGNGELLREAEFAAEYLATWCVAYDYHFPPESVYGKLAMETCGTVYANTQNRHSAPGCCSYSCDALLKLYRATGRIAYGNLLRQIVHAIPRYMALEERPIGELDPYCINERINMGDWDGKEFIGHSFNCSCWPETSLLLTRIHIPGVYANTTRGEILAFDHVEACWDDEKNLLLHNPTIYPAEVTILVENSAEAALPLKSSIRDKFSVRTILPGESTTLDCRYFDKKIRKQVK